MNKCRISSEQYIPIPLGGVPFTKLLVLMLDNIFIKYDIKIVFVFSSDTSIHIATEGTTVEQVRNEILVSG
jgi:hypothetical protein